MISFNDEIKDFTEKKPYAIKHATMKVTAGFTLLFAFSVLGHLGVNTPNISMQTIAVASASSLSVLILPTLLLWLLIEMTINEQRSDKLAEKGNAPGIRLMLQIALSLVVICAFIPLAAKMFGFPAFEMFEHVRHGFALGIGGLILLGAALIVLGLGSTFIFALAAGINHSLPEQYRPSKYCSKLFYHNDNRDHHTKPPIPVISTELEHLQLMGSLNGVDSSPVLAAYPPL